MGDSLPNAQDCCLDCADPVVTAIPGPQGDPCTPCTDGTDGIDAFSFIDGGTFAVPAYGASVTVTLRLPQGSKWMAVDQLVFVTPYGYFQVTAKPSDTQATLLNVGNGTLYPGNVNNGVNFADGSQVSPAGVTGPQGAAGASGAPTDATYITQTPNGTLSAEQALSALATGLMKSTTGTGVVSIVPLGLAANDVAPVDAGGPLVAGQVVSVVAGGLKSDTAANQRTLLGLGTMSTQNANAVVITGGSVAGASGSFTTLAASGSTTLSGTVATPSGAIQTIGAASTIHTTAGKVKVVGNAGPVTVGTLPTCDNGVADGQQVIIQGTDDVNTVTVQDEGTLPGSKLRLGSATRALGKGDTLRLSWDTTDGKWYEVGFTNLV